MDIDIMSSNSSTNNDINTNTTTATNQPPIITTQLIEHETATADRDEAASFDYIQYNQQTKKTTKDISPNVITYIELCILNCFAFVS